MEHVCTHGTMVRTRVRTHNTCDITLYQTLIVVVHSVPVRAMIHVCTYTYTMMVRVHVTGGGGGGDDGDGTGVGAGGSRSAGADAGGAVGDDEQKEQEGATLGPSWSGITVCTWVYHHW
jgi:hypothetical protein